MRIGVGDEFLRSTGGILTGALTVSANVEPLLTLRRPDGASSHMLTFDLSGVDATHMHLDAAQPRLRIRDNTLADRLTIHMGTGLLGTSLIPLSMLKIDEQTAENAGAIGAYGAKSTLVTLALAAVAAGDRIISVARVFATKDATAGRVDFGIEKDSGTATIDHPVSEAWEYVATNLLANQAQRVVVTSFIQVTGGGTLTLRISGQSGAGGVSHAAGGVNIHALVLRG